MEGFCLILSEGRPGHQLLPPRFQSIFFQGRIKAVPHLGGVLAVEVQKGLGFKALRVKVELTSAVTSSTSAGLIQLCRTLFTIVPT